MFVNRDGCICGLSSRRSSPRMIMSLVSLLAEDILWNVKFRTIVKGAASMMLVSLGALQSS